jgi:hypothetical protein
VFQPLAARLCRQNELTNLAITQAVEFPLQSGLAHWLTITLGLGTALSGWLISHVFSALGKLEKLSATSRRS